MNPRMKQPAMIVPGAMDLLQRLGEAPAVTGVPRTTLEMVNVRAGQINGCGLCVDMHTRARRAAEESDERIACVAPWREVPYYDDAGLLVAIATINAWNRLSVAGHQVGGELVTSLLQPRHGQELQKLSSE